MQGLRPAAAVTPSPIAAGTPRKNPRWVPVTALRFVGCDSCGMTLEEFENYPEDGRKVEYYDSESGLAWMLRDAPSPDHESPGAILAAILHEISQSRGSRVRCLGSAQLRLLDAASGQVGAMAPDQMVFLHPERLDIAGARYLRVGEDAYPDVVLEVDHTTDVRRSKLALYREWGFPELWVEVPDAYSKSRSRSRKRELRIYLLEGEGYALSAESRAFPGWRAAEIHRALNERTISAETSAVLARVGRALGEREGTGPDDDPLLGSYGRRKLAEGRVEGRWEMAREILGIRGIEISAGFPDRLGRDPAGFPDVPRRTIAAAASAAESEADFFARLHKPTS